MSIKMWNWKKYEFWCYLGSCLKRMLKYYYKLQNLQSWNEKKAFLETWIRRMHLKSDKFVKLIRLRDKISQKAKENWANLRSKHYLPVWTHIWYSTWLSCKLLPMQQYQTRNLLSLRSVFAGRLHKLPT